MLKVFMNFFYTKIVEKCDRYQEMCKLKMAGMCTRAVIFPVKPRFLHDKSIYLIEIK